MVYLMPITYSCITREIVCLLSFFGNVGNGKIVSGHILFVGRSGAFLRTHRTLARGNYNDTEKRDPPYHIILFLSPSAGEDTRGVRIEDVALAASLEADVPSTSPLFSREGSAIVLGREFVLLPRVIPKVLLFQLVSKRTKKVFRRSDRES